MKLILFVLLTSCVEWTWKEYAEMVKFSKSPIKTSLLKFEKSELTNLAVNCFIGKWTFLFCKQTQELTSKAFFEENAIVMLLNELMLLLVFETALICFKKSCALWETIRWLKIKKTSTVSISCCRRCIITVNWSTKSIASS